MTGGRPNDPLRAFYEAEAARRTRVHQGPIRLQLRGEFVDLVRRERRRSIVDFGAGPGLDSGAFGAAGFDAIGVDLAVANAALAGEAGTVVIPGSVTAAPLRSDAFDAGWSMSTLMHLEPPAMMQAAHELARVLRPGAPALVGLWGDDHEGTTVDTGTIEGHQRPFHNRSPSTNGQVLRAAFGSIESQRVLDIEGAEHHYQVFALRAPAPDTVAVSIKGVLVWHDEVVLLHNERNEWELPGGRPEPGDASHATTLRREFDEELGLAVTVGDFVDTWRYEPLPGRPITVHTYLVHAERPTTALMPSDEHDAVGCFPITAVNELVLPDGYRASIAKALAALGR